MSDAPSRPRRYTKAADRGLPHNWETERAALGALLLAPERLAEVRAILDPAGGPEAFHRPAHQHLYALLCELSAAGVPADTMVALDEIERRDCAERCGGVAYVIALPQACASVDNIRAYAARVADTATRRAGLLAARHLEADILDGVTSTDELAPRLRALGVVGPGSEQLDELSIRGAVRRFLSRLDPARGTGPGLARFDWPGSPGDLDPGASGPRIPPGALLPHDAPGAVRAPAPGPWRRTAVGIGPLTAGTVAVLVGATGRGKSAFALQVFEGVTRRAPGLYVSVEMDTDELIARLLSLRSSGSVAWSSILLGRVGYQEVEAAAAYLVTDCPDAYVWAPGPNGRTIAAIQERARRVSAAHGGAAPFVVLDYLQRLAPPGAEDRRIAVGDVSAGLRDLSRPGTPMGPDWPGAGVLVLSSVARGAYDVLEACAALRSAARGGTGPKGESVAPRPLVGLGKESGEVEYDAPIVLVFTSDQAPPDRPRDPRPALLAVAKNRAHGGSAVIDYIFHPAAGRFDELDGPPPAPLASVARPSGRSYRDDV